MAKTLLQKTWHFIWEEDSIWSWIVNLVLAFVLIKYIIFPVLGLILGSQFPVVAVMSDSMEHNGNFDVWWNSQASCNGVVCTQEKFYAGFNITKEQFRTFILKNGFNTGDVMFLSSPKNVKIGDIIVFFSKDGRPIIHRVISLDPLQTKGDKNQAQITPATNPYINEKNVSANGVIGKVSLRIPLLGYVKIIFVWFASLFGMRLM